MVKYFVLLKLSEISLGEFTPATVTRDITTPAVTPESPTRIVLDQQGAGV